METRANRPWTRRHDDPRTDLFPSIPLTAYADSLAGLIDLCRNHPPAQRLHAAGSHWALSEAAISDHTVIETHDPMNAVQAMGRTLHDVVPACLDPRLLDRMTKPRVSFATHFGTLIHIESGKRIDQLYAELDQVDPCTDPATLGGYVSRRGHGPRFAGPWGFETLGGAGGQTVVGAFSTGTHGGDFDRGPLADSVVALHLVADGGQHYWIESIDPDRYGPQLTDDARLKALYGDDAFGGPNNFHIIRDNDIFDAVLVSVGRFGVIYSAVLRAIPQYSLWERRRLHVWQDWKSRISSTSPDHRDLFADQVDGAADAPDARQRFLQVVVCLTPHVNMQRNLAGITKR